MLHRLTHIPWLSANTQHELRCRTLASHRLSDAGGQKGMSAKEKDKKEIKETFIALDLN